LTDGLAVVIGDVINDIVVRPLAPPAAGTDTPASVQQRPGGSGANQAAWMAALGARVRFAGRAGWADAERHRLALERAGVDARLAVDPARGTGTIVVVVGADGERSMYTDRGASAALDASDLPIGLLDGAALLHVSGYALFEERSRAAVGRLWEAAGGGGLSVSVDPASVAGLVDVGSESFLSWTDGATLAFPNWDEGRLLAGADRPGAIVDALLVHYAVVALKLGPRGVLVASRQGDRLELSSPTEGALDSTGAGDAFCAGFLTAFLAGRDLRHAANLGLEASGRAVRLVGGRPPQGSAVL
jgi:sugar/nucleoside kinase (ribokinase family)